MVYDSYILLVLSVGFTVSLHSPFHQFYPNESAGLNNIVKCIKHVMQHNPMEPGFLIFGNIESFNPNIQKLKNDLLKSIHEANQFLVQIIGPDDKPLCDNGGVFNREFQEYNPYNFAPVADYFLITVESYKDFTYSMRKIIRSRLWNSKTKCIIILYHLHSPAIENKRIVEQILSCSFQYNVIDIIVCVPEGISAQNTAFYSWVPYDPPNYCGYFNETAENRLVLNNYCENGKFKYEAKLWEKKLPLNMLRCTLHVIALERQPFISNNVLHPNLEQWIVDTVFKKFNFSIHYEVINSFRGERNEKGLWNGALKELNAKTGHILLGGIYPDYDVHEDFEWSSSYLADSYTWIVPRAQSSPPWASLHIIFQNLVWYFTFIVFITCVITWTVLGYLSQDSYYNQNFGHCFFNTWLCLLGLVVYVRPKKQSVRIFFIFLNLYGIIILTAYQAKLIDTLQNPIYQDQIDTVEKLMKSELKVGGSEELRDLFYNSSDRTDQFITQKWITINNMSKALLDVVVSKNFSVLCSRLELIHLTSVLPELSDNNGRNTYYAFPKNALTISLEMLAFKGFPFIKEISNDLNIYKELGIDSVLTENFRYLSMRHRATLLNTSKNEENCFSLSIQHLLGGIIILFVGMFCGTVVLLLELLSVLLTYKNI